MSIRFRTPRGNALSRAARGKSPKKGWQTIALPSGLVSDIFNRFAEAHGNSLKEIYLSSRVASPLCQADVDSAQAMMASLTAQEISSCRERKEDCLTEINQLLAELDLTPEQLSHFQEEGPRQAKTTALQELTAGPVTKELPVGGQGEPEIANPLARTGRGGRLNRKAGKTKPAPGLKYAEVAAKETASKSKGGR